MEPKAASYAELLKFGRDNLIRYINKTVAYDDRDNNITGVEEQLNGEYLQQMHELNYYIYTDASTNMYDIQCLWIHGLIRKSALAKLMPHLRSFSWVVARDANGKLVESYISADLNRSVLLWSVDYDETKNTTPLVEMDTMLFTTTDPDEMGLYSVGSAGVAANKLVRAGYKVWLVQKQTKEPCLITRCALHNVVHMRPDQDVIPGYDYFRTGINIDSLLVGEDPVVRVVIEAHKLGVFDFYQQLVDACKKVF